MFNYSVVYEHGFAVTCNLHHLCFLLERDSNIEIDTFNSSWEAYCCGCAKYSEQCIRRAYVQCIMPKFEDVTRQPYYEPKYDPNFKDDLDFKENVPAERYFAVMNSGYIGVFDNLNSVINFVREFNMKVHVKEFSSQEMASKYLEEQFLRFILPRSAYINGEFSYIRKVPLNEILSTQELINWFHQSYHPPYAWENFNSYQINYLPPIQTALESPTMTLPQIR